MQKTKRTTAAVACAVGIAAGSVMMATPSYAASSNVTHHSYACSSFMGTNANVPVTFYGSTISGQRAVTLVMEFGGTAALTTDSVTTTLITTTTSFSGAKNPAVSSGSPWVLGPILSPAGSGDVNVNSPTHQLFLHVSTGGGILPISCVPNAGGMVDGSGNPVDLSF